MSTHHTHSCCPPPESTDHCVVREFPRFALPIERCGIEESSPIPVTVEELRRFAAGWPKRANLMDRFMTVVGILNEQMDVP